MGLDRCGRDGIEELSFRESFGDGPLKTESFYGFFGGLMTLSLLVGWFLDEMLGRGKVERL